MSDSRPNIVVGLTMQADGEFGKSVAQYPNIKPGEEFTGYKAASGS